MLDNVTKKYIIFSIVYISSKLFAGGLDGTFCEYIGAEKIAF